MKNGLPWIDPALLRHRITFLDQKIVTDASGTGVVYQAGNPPERCWAELMPVRGIDLIKAGQDVSQVTVMATIRYRASATAQRRIRMKNGSVYVIQAIENVLEMGTYQVMTCLGLGSNQ